MSPLPAEQRAEKWQPTTMLGVLIIEDAADQAHIHTQPGELQGVPFVDDVNPTQEQVLHTARWLGMDPYDLAFNCDVDFDKLPPGDLSLHHGPMPFVLVPPVSPAEDSEDDDQGPFLDLPPTREDLLWFWGIATGCLALAVYGLASLLFGW